MMASVVGAGPGPRAFAADASVNYAALGRAKFTQKKYDEAIDLFRKHLRRAPKDYNVWNQLGAAYYHTGQPRKALRYLKHVEKTTTEKSYNYYYQGLCYLAADTPDKAKDFFTYAAAPGGGLQVGKLLPDMRPSTSNYLTASSRDFVAAFARS